MVSLLQRSNENFMGNIIPHDWYLEIKSQSGKPEYTAISLLSEIVYWYRPNKEGRSKFSGDLWQTSYEYFERKFGYNKQKIRRALVRLEDLGLISRVYRTIVKFGQKYPNVLFIQLIKLPEITSSTNVIHETVYPHFLPVASCNDLVTDSGTSSFYSCTSQQIQSNTLVLDQKTKEKNFYSLFETGDYKSDTPSLQICRDHYIDKENKKENIKKRSDLRASTRSNSHIFLLERKEQEKTIVDQASKQNDNRVVIVKPHNAKKEEKRIFSVISNKTSDFFKKLKETMKVRDWEEGRGLLELCDISQETVEKLNKNSGREFGRNFIRQLIQMLGQKYQEYRFYREEHFISYMSKALANELRQAPVANNLDFRFKALPMTREEEYLRKVNKYLEEIEGSTSQGKDMLWKKKVVGHFEPRLAYELLKGTIVNLRIAAGEGKDKEEDKGEDKEKVEEAPFVLEIKQIRQLETSLGESEEMLPDWIKGILLKIGREVYGDRVGGIEVEKLCNERSLSMSGMPGINKKWEVSQKRELEIEEPRGVSVDDSKDDSCWGKVQKELKLLYGNATYKTWFKDLSISEEEKTLKIKTPTSFIRDWVKTNYGRQIEEIMKGYFKELNYLEFV